MPTLFLVTEEAANLKHGSGKQLQRLFQRPGDTYVNLFFGNLYGESAFPSHSFHAPEYQHWYDAGSVPGKLRAGLIRSYFERAVHPDRFDRVLATFPAPDLAYVMVSTEAKARMMLPLLRRLGCPYVLHFMDLYHSEGLNPATMPGFAALLAGAHHVFAITENLADELRKFGANPELLFIGEALTPRTATAPLPNAPLRLLLIGGSYPTGSALLAEAWPSVQATFPGIELHYAGSQFDKLPAALQPHVTNHGLIQQPDVLQDLLCSAHLAYLPGPSDLDWLGRFSYPSRTSDYFMSGLPTLACVAEGTAARRVLAPLAPTGLQFVADPAQFTAAIATLTQTPERWSEASATVRRFAEQNLDIAAVRARVFTLLDGLIAAKSGTILR